MWVERPIGPIVVELRMVSGVKAACMNFAWLGDAPETLPLGRAIAHSREHALVAAALSPHCHAELAREARGLRLCASWEELLADESIDTFVVSGDNAEVLQGARQLASAGRALVVFPTLAQSETFLHELALLETEGTVRLFPVFPPRFHPFIERVRSLLASGTLGKIRHLQLDRSVPAAGDGRLLRRGEIDTAFLFDADLLRHLCGEYNQVTALRIGTDAEGVSLATVALAGKAVPTAAWSMSANAASGTPPWSLTVTGEHGKVLLSGDPAQHEFTLRIDGAAPAEPAQTLVCDAGPRILESIGAALSRAPSELSPPADWTDVTRALELLYAVDNSLRRRRTIDVYFEAPSERSTFKTKMTAAGCSLLMFTLVAVVVYLGIAATVPLHATLKKILVGLIFLPLGIFLAMQLLYFITKPAK